MSDLTQKLEDEVLVMLLDGDDPVLEVLRRQLVCARRSSRELTGAGFFTNFEVPSTAYRFQGQPSFTIGDVVAEIEGLQFGAGFVLHVVEGALNFLEAFSYEEPWPKSITSFKLSYPNNQRDYASLRSARGWPVQE